MFLNFNCHRLPRYQNQQLYFTSIENTKYRNPLVVINTVGISENQQHDHNNRAFVTPNTSNSSNIKTNLSYGILTRY